MKFSSFRRSSLIAALILASHGTARPAGAAFGDVKAPPDATAPAEAEAPSPVAPPAAPPGLGGAAKSAAAGVATVVAVDETDTTTAALWEKLRSGALDPEEAWNSKELDTKSVEAILNNGESSDLKYRDLALKLVGVLDKHDPEHIADPAKQESRARNLIVVYFEKKNDPRTVPYYEYIISLIKRPSPNTELSFFYLSDYYARIGDLRKAAETRLRYEDYSTDPIGLACSKLEAGRFYRRLGDDKKADDLYSQVSKFGYGWASGIALYDQSSILIKQGKYELARKVLQQPVTGLYSEQVQIALLTQLGYSYFRTEEFSWAEKYCRDGLEAASKVELLANEGLEQNLSQAKEIIRLCQHWGKNPLICEPSSVSLNIPSNKTNKPLMTFFKIKTFLPDTPLLVSSNNNGMKVVRIEKSKEGEEPDYHFWGRNIMMEISPVLLKQNTEVVLTITSPRYVGFEVHLNLRIFVDFLPSANRKPVSTTTN